jgi:hypothetical protein
LQRLQVGAGRTGDDFGLDRRDRDHSRLAKYLCGVDRRNREMLGENSSERHFAIRSRTMATYPLGTAGASDNPSCKLGEVDRGPWRVPSSDDGHIAVRKVVDDNEGDTRARIETRRSLRHDRDSLTSGDSS